MTEQGTEGETCVLGPELIFLLFQFSQLFMKGGVPVPSTSHLPRSTRMLSPSCPEKRGPLFGSSQPKKRDWVSCMSRRGNLLLEELLDPSAT